MLRNTIIASALAIGASVAGVTGAQACSSFGSSNCGPAAWEDRTDRWYYQEPDAFSYQSTGYEYAPDATVEED